MPKRRDLNHVLVIGSGAAGLPAAVPAPRRRAARRISSFAALATETVSRLSA